jgi:hypothetical protein
MMLAAGAALLNGKWLVHCFAINHTLARVYCSKA